MDKKYLNNEFDRFFEFPTEDRSKVSSESCKLFAEHIAYPVLMDNVKLTEKLERVANVCRRKLDGGIELIEAMKTIENIMLSGEQGN